VNFVGNAEEDQVSGVDDTCRQHFDAAAELLGLDADDLFNTLTKQNMYVNNSVIVKVQNISQVRMMPFNSYDILLRVAYL
jgi:myosin heavy subunit